MTRRPVAGICAAARFSASPIAVAPSAGGMTRLCSSARAANLIYVARATQPYTDGEGSNVFVVISLMQAGDIEVRLLRSAPLLGPDGAPSAVDNVFGVFNLTRRRDRAGSRRRASSCDETGAAMVDDERSCPTPRLEPADVHEMELLDRYRTTAARAYSRSLNDLYKLKKTKANEDRWRQHFELQKRRFDLDLERFNLAKTKHQPPPAEPDPGPDSGPEPTLEDIPIPDAAEAPPPSSHVSQTLYIGVENKKTTVYEVTPSNAKLRRTLRPVRPCYSHLQLRRLCPSRVSGPHHS